MAYGVLVFTDLDGTLLDADSQSWSPAAGAINELKKREMPIMPVSSKTRAEAESFMKQMEVNGPLITENGSGIFVPKGYFPFEFKYDREVDNYCVIDLAQPYSKVREVLSELKGLGEIVGFGDMSTKEIAEEMARDESLAELAKKREYEEVFRFSGDEEVLKKALGERGVTWTSRGRYWRARICGDKGEAVKRLVELYKTADSGLKTVGLGDSFRDVSLLKAVDVPILIRRKDGSFDPEVTLECVRKSDSPGPQGWGEEIMKVLGEIPQG